MAVNLVKSLIEPRCFLGGYSLTTGCYVLSVVGLVSVSALQISNWVADDTSDINVNLIQYTLLSIEILFYLLLAFVSKLHNFKLLKCYFGLVLVWALLQWLWLGSIAYHDGSADILQCRAWSAFLSTVSASLVRGSYKQLARGPIDGTNTAPSLAERTMPPLQFQDDPQLGLQQQRRLHDQQLRNQQDILYNQQVVLYQNQQAMIIEQQKLEQKIRILQAQQMLDQRNFIEANVPNVQADASGLQLSNSVSGKDELRDNFFTDKIQNKFNNANNFPVKQLNSQNVFSTGLGTQHLPAWSACRDPAGQGMPAVTGPTVDYTSIAQPVHEDLRYTNTNQQYQHTNNNSNQQLLPDQYRDCCNAVGNCLCPALLPQVPPPSALGTAPVGADGCFRLNPPNVERVSDLSKLQQQCASRGCNMCTFPTWPFHQQPLPQQQQFFQ